MGPLATRRLLRRLRARTLGLAVVLALAGATALHHAEPMDGMGSGHHDGGAMAAMQLCLGAFVAVGTAVAAVRVGVVRLGRWKPVLRLVPSAPLLAADVPAPVPRAGPRLLCLLCVSRR